MLKDVDDSRIIERSRGLLHHRSPALGLLLSDQEAVQILQAVESNMTGSLIKIDAAAQRHLAMRLREIVAEALQSSFYTPTPNNLLKLGKAAKDGLRLLAANLSPVINSKCGRLLIDPQSSSRNQLKAMIGNTDQLVGLAKSERGSMKKALRFLLKVDEFQLTFPYSDLPDPKYSFKNFPGWIEGMTKWIDTQDNWLKRYRAIGVVRIGRPKEVWRHQLYADLAALYEQLTGVDSRFSSRTSSKNDPNCPEENPGPLGRIILKCHEIVFRKLQVAPFDNLRSKKLLLERWQVSGLDSIRKIGNEALTVESIFYLGAFSDSYGRVRHKRITCAKGKTRCNDVKFRQIFLT